MRYAVTLRRGGKRQVYDAQYASRDDAVFGVLRKETARDMIRDRGRAERHLPDLPLEITIRRATGDDVVNLGFAKRRRAKGCQRVA